MRAVLPAGKDLKAKTGIIAATALIGVFATWVTVGRMAAAEMVYPVENGASWFSRHVSHPLKEAMVRPRLAAENRRLALEIARLKMLLADRDVLAAENDRLRTALDFADRAKGEWIPAPVLSRGGSLGAGAALRIGKGSLAGVRSGAAVASPDGLVGRVSDVSPHTAEVRLITDPSVKVACETDAGGHAAFGILSGGRLMHLKRDFVLQPHAKIITSGLGGVYPRGLTVGFLRDGTHEDETQLEREGEVVPAVDFPSLEDVFIRREE